jgi:hypothetical protein
VLPSTGPQWIFQIVVLVILAVVGRSYFTATAEARLLADQLEVALDSVEVATDAHELVKATSDSLIALQDRNEEVTDSILTEAEATVTEAVTGTDAALAAARNAAADLPIVAAALELVTTELEEERTANEIFRATSAAEIFAGQQRERTLGIQLISERTAASTEITRLNTALTLSMQESAAWERAASPGALTQVWRQGRAAVVVGVLVFVIASN